MEEMNDRDDMERFSGPNWPLIINGILVIAFIAWGAYKTWDPYLKPAIQHAIATMRILFPGRQ